METVCHPAHKSLTMKRCARAPKGARVNMLVVDLVHIVCLVPLLILQLSLPPPMLLRQAAMP